MVEDVRGGALGPKPLRTNLQTPSRMNAEGIKRRALLDQRILVVSLDDHRLGWADKLALKSIAEKLYGDF